MKPLSPHERLIMENMVTKIPMFIRESKEIKPSTTQFEIGEHFMCHPEVTGCHMPSMSKSRVYTTATLIPNSIVFDPLNNESGYSVNDIVTNIVWSQQDAQMGTATEQAFWRKLAIGAKSMRGAMIAWQSKASRSHMEQMSMPYVRLISSYSYNAHTATEHVNDFVNIPDFFSIWEEEWDDVLIYAQQGSYATYYDPCELTKPAMDLERFKAASEAYLEDTYAIHNKKYAPTSTPAMQLVEIIPESKPAPKQGTQPKFTTIGWSDSSTVDEDNLWPPGWSDPT